MARVRIKKEKRALALLAAGAFLRGRCRLDAHAKDARNLVRNRYRTVGKGEACRLGLAFPMKGDRQILIERGRAAESRLDDRLDGGAHLGPHGPEWLAQSAWVLVAEDGAIGVVIDEDPLGTPDQEHRERRAQQHFDLLAQGLRPCGGSAYPCDDAIGL